MLALGNVELHSVSSFSGNSTTIAIGLYISSCGLQLHICPRNQVSSFWVPFLSPIPHLAPTASTDNKKIVPFIEPLWLPYTFYILILQILSRPSNEGTQSLNEQVPCPRSQTSELGSYLRNTLVWKPMLLILCCLHLMKCLHTMKAVPGHRPPSHYRIPGPS